MIHLDTNIVIAYFNGDKEIAAKIKNSLPDVAISSLVLAELLYGARASVREEENTEKVNQFIQIVDVVDFDQESAETYSKIRVSLRKKGRPTGEIDLLIASIAVTHDATLITHNTRHFENIDELDIEDWIF
jgi:tRNA(fMet)-specific endonuclease VapC